MRRRFFWSLLGAVAATLLIVGVLGALVTLSVVRAQTRTEMQRQIGQIVELVQDALVSDGVDLDAARCAICCRRKPRRPCGGFSLRPDE